MAPSYAWHVCNASTRGTQFPSSVPNRVLRPCVGLLVLVVVVGTTRAEQPDAADRYFGIQVVDDQTLRGIPLVELETVHNVRYVTDSGGWIAIDEPGWMGREVFFHVRSHGYEYPRDGFGFAGVVLTPQPGSRAVIRLSRRNIAERLYRITGEGIYRDSVLLGQPVPLAEPVGTAQVTGQDSAFAVPYREQIFWFWGDTNRLRYPLGHFWMAGATSELPGRGGLDPSVGVNLSYFVDGDGFSRPMARLGVEEGLIWIDAVCVLPDQAGRPRLVCHYAHMKSLGQMIGHGLAVYNDDSQSFERLTALDIDQLWRYPGQAHPVRHQDVDGDYLYLGEVFPTVRVPATLESFLDPSAYQAWSCLRSGGDLEEPSFERDAAGRVEFAWRQNAVPIDIATQWRWIESGKLTAEEACFVPRDIETDEPIRLHRGSVAWNPHRQRWIVIAGQQHGISYLGEIWYAEAPALTGPWRRARKVVTHERYSFYNPVHHPCFDQDHGRVIYFEGTYTTTFSGNPVPTPRYDYNQIMYRLDLDDPRLNLERQGTE
jgi:hypothetical protein